MADFKVLDVSGKPVKTKALLHPGQVLAEELEARKIPKKDFAVAIGVQPSHLSDLFKGKRHVSAKLALQLERQLNIDAAFWLRVQMAYDLVIARKEMQIA